MAKQQKWENILLAIEQKDISKVIAEASLEEIKRLVDECKLDIREPIEECFGNSPIHEAARLDKLGTLKYFIEEKHGDVNVRNEFSETPIFLAADRDHMRIVKYLVERGADVTTTDSQKNNILYIAARTGSIALAEYLLDKRKAPFNMNWKNKLNMTIVHYAAKFNQLTFLKYVVGRKKADIHIRDKSGRTALHFAAQVDNFEVLKYLLKQGANAEIEDVYGMKPWQLAKEQKMIDYLRTESDRYKRSAPLFTQNRTNHFVFPSSSVGLSHGQEIGCTTAELTRSPLGFPRFYLVLTFIDFCLRHVMRYNNFNSKCTRISTSARSVRTTYYTAAVESEIDSFAIEVVSNSVDVYSSVPNYM